MSVVKLIKALAHENRLRILNLLQEQALCVCELRNLMDINQSNASRHLAKLKQADLLEYNREGQWVYYQLNKANVEEHSFIQKILNEELAGEQFEIDLERLELYQESEIGCDNLDEAEIF